jgi:cholest-4-en-3-one 26-monooxygenase
VTLTDLDVTSTEQWIDGIPHEQFARLRREAPVFRHRGTDEHMPEWFWCLTRHEDVQMANRDAETFSSGRGGVLLDVMQSLEERESFRTIIDSDAPEHTRLRRLVNRGFTPRSIATFEEQYRSAVRRVLAEAMRTPSFDFVSEVATPLPAFAISELLGVPEPDRPQITTWTNQISGRSDPEFNDGPDAPLIAATDLYTYATTLAEQRRAEPRDDIVTRLITEVDNDALGAHEFEMFMLALAVAGNETTRTAISQGVLALLNHPHQMLLLRENPDELLASAVDEIIRWATPIVYFRRTATRDVEMHGTLIRENDPVVLFYMSANYDETVFADPHRFDVTRSPNPHVSFGGGGAHFCLGAHLAQLEIRVLLDELISSTRSIVLEAPADRLRSSWVNGLKRLPVTVVATQ